MAKTNLKPRYDHVKTAEGAPAFPHVNPLQQLRRQVMSCMLWEKEFYFDGATIADQISKACSEVLPEQLAAVAIEARSVHNLRHVPLLLLIHLARQKAGKLTGDTIAEVIQRADELSEFLALYWRNGKTPIAKQVKRGLALAFQKFDAYKLAKYNRDSAIKLRDVLFMVHAKPKDEEQAALWKQLVEGTLPTPDTWETNLSSGKDKRETWERLLRDGQLGYLALLRNLRNMEQAGADEALVRDAILARKGAHRVLPFRYIAAARAAPKMEATIDQAMLAALAQTAKLPGKTIMVVDVSGSMYGSKLSAKSDMDRALAGCALASIVREVCENPVIYATAGSDASRIHQTALVPARRGMALVDAIHGMCRPLGGGGIFLKQVMDYLHEKEKTADRVIVVTDEQDCGINAGDAASNARMFDGAKHYIINVASAKNGVGYGKWTHIDGFSEGVLRFIAEIEKDDQQATV